MNVNEEFKAFPYNHSLEVSKSGTIRKTDNREILEQKKYKEKYFTVEYPGEKRKFEFVHRLVALTWLNDTFEKGKRLVVHHIDGNGFNNNADNLKWMNACDHVELEFGTVLACEDCEDTKCKYCGTLRYQ